MFSATSVDIRNNVECRDEVKVQSGKSRERKRIDGRRGEFIKVSTSKPPTTSKSTKNGTQMSACTSKAVVRAEEYGGNSRSLVRPPPANRNKVALARLPDSVKWVSPQHHCFSWGFHV